MKSRAFSRLEFRVAVLEPQGNRQGVLIISRDRPILWRDLLAEIKKNFIPVAPTPAFGRIVTLDDGMARAMKMRGRMAVGRGIAAADMAAAPADSQMQPAASHLETFLAASRARLNLPDRADV